MDAQYVQLLVNDIYVIINIKDSSNGLSFSYATLLCILVGQKMFIYDLFLFWCRYLYLRYDNNTLIKYFKNYD